MVIIIKIFKNYLFSFFFIGISLGYIYPLQGQTRILIDDLRNSLKQTEKSKMYNNNCLLLSDLYNAIQINDSTVLWANKSLAYGVKHKNEQQIADAHIRLAKNFIDEFKLDIAIQHDSIALEIYSKLNQEIGIAKALAIKGAIYSRMGRIQAALSYQKESLALFQKLNNKINQLYSLKELGALYAIGLGDKEQALSYLEECLALYPKIEGALNIAFAESIIGNVLYYIGKIHMDQQDFVAANKALTRCQNLSSKNDNKYWHARSLRMKGNMYAELNNKTLAIQNYKAAIAVQTALKDSIELAMTLYSLGEMYKSQKDNEKALSYLEESLRFFINNHHSTLYSLISIGLIQTEKGQLEKAKYYERTAAKKLSTFSKDSIYYLDLRIKILVLEEQWTEALGAAQQLHRLAEAASLLIFQEKAVAYLLEVHQALGEYKQALNYSLLKVNLKDSLFREEHKKLAYSLALEYKTQQKEAEILVLQQKQKLHDAKLQNQQKWLFMMIGVGLISILFILLLYTNNQKNKKLANQETELRKSAHNLFGNLSHEFKTPLTILRIPLEEMKKGIFKGDPNPVFDVMLKNVYRLSELVNQMLDVSKMNERQFQLNLKHGDILDFIRSYVGQFASFAEQKQLILALELPVLSLSLRYDKEILTKILNNLISNAIKFTEKGKISVHFRYYHKHFELEVKDTGIGISSGDLSHVFDRYYSNPLDARKVGSNFGLGLSLVKQLVDLYKGEIAIKSELGKGTTFSLKLPHDENFTTADLPKQYELITFNEPNKKSINALSNPIIVNKPLKLAPLLNKNRTKLKKLLIVEDNLDLNKLIYDRLIQKYQVSQAYNGLEGFEKAKKIVPDMVLTDIMMPELDGISLAKKIQNSAETSHIPLIVFSALKDTVKHQEIFEAGAIDFVSKPIDFQILERKIHNLVSKREKFKTEIQRNNWLYVGVDRHLSGIDETFLKNLREVLMKNMSDPTMNVEKISQLMFMSRVSLYRKIKALTGMTPTALMYKLKMQHAYKLLEQNKGKIAEIGQMVGVTNPSFFSRKFKAEFGINPGEILKN